MRGVRVFEIAEPYACQECPLQDCPGLRPLDDAQLAYMQSVKEAEFSCERGDIVLKEGDETDHLFTVLDGVAIRYLELEDGRRQIINFMFPGDLIGLQGDEITWEHEVDDLPPAVLQL